MSSKSGNNQEGGRRTELKSLKTLIVGVGNPILGDDGIGPRIAERLKCLVDEDRTTVTEANVGGVGLVELLVGYDRAIIIDAVQTVNGKPGHIYRFDPSALRSSRKAGPLHDLDFSAALELGKQIGLALPRQITVFAVEATDVHSFSEDCSPDLKEAIPICVDIILEELEGGTGESSPDQRSHRSRKRPNRKPHPLGCLRTAGFSPERKASWRLDAAAESCQAAVKHPHGGGKREHGDQAQRPEIGTDTPE